MSGFETYVEAWRRRWASGREEAERSAVEARALAGRLAGRLAADYGVRRVVLLGSLARGEFGRGSDIDLAAEGIPDRLFFRAGADLEAAGDGLGVDLIPIESATAAMRERIATEGIVLYESGSSPAR